MFLGEKLTRKVNCVEDPLQNRTAVLDEQGNLLGYAAVVNLPSTLEDYESGNGEGCWALFSPADFADAYETEKAGGRYPVYLLNSSFYHPSLTWGTLIYVEMRGGYRPVLCLDQIPMEKLGGPAAMRREAIIQKVMERSR